MSGILASSVIKKNCSCKLYTNSSGNPASITIHSVVPSTTGNACLSIKASATDACLFRSSIVETDDIPLQDTVSVVADDGYKGYTCLDTGQSNFFVSYAYVDCAGTETVPQADRTIQKSGASCFYADETYRITDCRCLSTRFCSSRCTEICGGCNKCPSLFRLLNTNLPNFHTSSSGEKHRQLPIDSCYPTSQMWVRFDGSYCCCGIDLTTAEKKYESYLTAYDNANNPDDYSYCNLSIASNIGLFVQDLWSDFGTAVTISNICPPNQCQPMCYLVREANGTIYSTTMCLCCSSDLYSVNPRKILRECCNCFSCCCSVETAETTQSFATRRTVMMGCDVTFFQSFCTNCTHMVVYPFDCVSTFNSLYKCALSGPFGKYGMCHCEFACTACKSKLVSISGIGRGMIQWVWYNPYVNCNYFFIMPSSTTSNTCRGIFTFEPSCLAPFCSVDNCGDNSFNANLQTHLDSGFIQKAGDIPDVWTRFYCFEGDSCTGMDYNAHMWTAMSNPVLVGECCWALWAQCFNWGDRSIANTGWNGCFLRYHSNNLTDWSLTENTILLATTEGTGDAVCSVCYETDASNITEYVDHFFNSANCVSDAGLLEYKTSANRLERTGIVLGDGDSVYVNNSGSDAGVTIWGYDE